MSIFGTILSKIFPGSHPAVTGAAKPAATATPASGAPGAPSASAPAAPASSGAASAPAQSAAPAAAQAEPVDVEAALENMAKTRGEQLNWRTSIVDLMKLLNLDSSLNARKQLAQELHYNGDMNDSAAMNIWLQKQVMTQLAANGGKVPDSLKH